MATKAQRKRHPATAAAGASKSVRTGQVGVPTTAERVGDILFLPVGAVLTLRDRGSEIFSELVAKGRKAEPRIRHNIEKVIERFESIEPKSDWLRAQIQSSSKRARTLLDDLGLEETLKNLNVRGRVDKVRSRLQEIVR